MKRAICMILASAFLAACGQTELYSDLSERDANEMMAVLRGVGIDASKREIDEESWSLMIADTQFVRAVETLKSQGYPKTDFADMGELFEKQGFVSTPLEERARYVFGLEQELSETVSAIDGVVMARVHLAVPENNPLAETAKPSSASVFVKHRAGADLTDETTQIKGLVVNSIEGLSYDHVTVALFAAPQTKLPEAEDAPAPLASASMLPVGLASIALVGGVALLLSTVGVRFWNRRRTEDGDEDAEGPYTALADKRETAP